MIWRQFHAVDETTVTRVTDDRFRFSRRQSEVGWWTAGFTGDRRGFTRQVKPVNNNESSIGVKGLEGLLDECLFVLNSMERIRYQNGIDGFRKMRRKCPRITVDRHDILDALLVGECFEFIEQLFVEIERIDGTRIGNSGCGQYEIAIAMGFLRVRFRVRSRDDGESRRALARVCPINPNRAVSCSGTGPPRIAR